MSDDKFTKTAASLLTGMRDLVDWGVAGGHTTPEQLRLAVVPRKAIPELKKQGLSMRQAAKVLGVSHQTVYNDVSNTLTESVKKVDTRPSASDPLTKAALKGPLFLSFPPARLSKPS